MRASLFITVILVLNTHGLGAERAYDPNVDTWSVLALAPRSGTFYRRADALTSQLMIPSKQWVVSRENEEVVARLVQDQKRQSSATPNFDTTLELSQFKRSAPLFAKVDDGWIAAYNVGEFGAAVYWYNEIGTTRRKLSHHHIQQFLPDGKRLFAVEGLFHMIMSSGSLVELRKEDGKWVCEEFLPLPEAGEAIARVAPGDYVIVTSSMLLRVNLNKEIEMNILIPRTHWFGPTSVAVAENGYVYIGTRRFVARCKLGKNVEDLEYLVPNKSWLHTNK
jgi:hypothetical protein